MANVKVKYRDGRIKVVREREARLLVRLGRASLVVETPPPPPPKPKPAAKTPRTTSAEAENPESKRVYRRRDLQAEE